MLMGMLLLHIFRGIYHGRYVRLPWVWVTGVIGLLLFIASAFLGYVLPWGQIRFWGATVIINLLGVIPFLGEPITNLLWGGYSVGDPTVVRFFSFHYLVSLACTPAILLHMGLLHIGGSGNPTGTQPISYASFHPHASSMDLVALAVVATVLIWLRTTGSHIFANIDNKIPANPMVTPVSIEPEWYFLPFYAMLRAVPHKRLGVACMAFAIVALFFMPCFGPIGPTRAWVFGVNFLILI